MIGRLTAKRVEQESTAGYHLDGDRLYLQVSRAGTKSWIFRYTVGGRERQMGLGPYPVVSLAEARHRAQAARQELSKGLDPLAERDRQREARRQAEALERARHRTFQQVATATIEALSPGWHNKKHAAQWTNTLTTYAYPIFKDRGISQLATQDVVDVLRPIWIEKHETANRVRQRIEKVFDFARANKWFDGENPARWKGHLDAILADTKASTLALRRGHFEAMDWAEIPAFMATLQKHEGFSARGLELAILTVARTNQIREARFEQFDFDASTWTIPAVVMKAKRPHVVPLTLGAIDLVQRIAAESGRTGDALVFSNDGKTLMSSDSMRMTLQRIVKGVTPHGFRASFRTWAGQMTHYPRDLIEEAMAHQIRNKAEAAYVRGPMLEKRRQLMDDWERFVLKDIALTSGRASLT
ncbi:tyrosine-type recombinase/integrase [Piscinibacterium candidicorallinum]|uniref:Tyrosine-type recombinase/integrase n=1 Tax=Piscinibacterium candidicorallinum TaxID=1793872 RepID=A0ABV7H3T9_9BURK